MPNTTEQPCHRTRLTQCFDSVETILHRPGAGFVLLAILTATYSLAYLGHPALPGANPIYPLGWIGYHDQGHSQHAAEALANFSLSRETYIYPLGYSLIAAPFVHFAPKHPFFIPNLIFCLTSAFMLFQITARLTSRLEACLMGSLLITFQPWLLRQTLVLPWNTILTQTIFYASIWIIITRRDRYALITLSVLAACAYVTRPADAICLAPMLVYATLRLPTWHQRIMGGLSGVAIIIVAVASVMTVNYCVFGDWKTPYDGVVADIGFFTLPLSFKTYWLLIDGFPFFEEETLGLLFRYPWTLLTLPAAVYWVKVEGGAAIASLASVAMSFYLYLNYNDLLPSNIYRFIVIHYWAWWLVLLAPIAYAGCTRGWKCGSTRIGFLLNLALVLTACCIELQLRPLKSKVAFIESEQNELLCQLSESAPLVLRHPSLRLRREKNIFLDGQKLGMFRDYYLPYSIPSDRLLLGPHSTKGLLNIQTVHANPQFRPKIYTFHWDWKPHFDRIILRNQ